MEKLRILTIDDDPHLSALVKVYLERTGLYEVQEVNCPADAITVARTYRPHGILLDVFMPGKDGRELAQEIKADPLLQLVPIMFLTAESTKVETESKRGIFRNKAPIVAKSNDPKVLVAAVARLLELPAPSELQLDEV